MSMCIWHLYDKTSCHPPSPCSPLPHTHTHTLSLSSSSSLSPPLPPLPPSFRIPLDLLQLTSSPHCQMSILVDLVGDRLRNTNWVVVFKGLIVSHNLMSLGNEVCFFKKLNPIIYVECVIMVCLNGVRPFFEWTGCCPTCI